MRDKELIKVLKGKAIGRSCSICEYHKNCGPGGCNVYQEAADRIEELLAERNSLARTLGTGWESREEIIHRVCGWNRTLKGRKRKRANIKVRER